LSDTNAAPSTATANANNSQLITVDQLRNQALGNLAQILSNIVTALKAIFPSGTGVSSTATGGAAVLPANPVGYVNITLPTGQPAKVPYYNP